MICLLPEQINNFKKALVTRKINIADLLNMETQASTELLKEYAGENAADVNKLFEEKLILKNRELGIKNALKKLTETGKYSPAEKARLDKIKSEWKAAQKQRIFSPKENEAFLNSLADKITGTEITREEAKTLFDLDRNVNNKLEAGFNEVTETWKSDQDRFDYELAKLAYEKYYQLLLHPEIELSDAVKQYLSEYSDIYKEFEGSGKLSQVIGTSIKGGAKVTVDAIKTLFTASRKVLSTADNSFFGTQGNQMMIDHPIEWAKQLVNSLKRIGKEFIGVNTLEPILMKMYSNPNYINGRMQKAGIVDMEDEIFGRVFDSNIKLGKTGKAITSTPVVSQVIEVGKRIDKAAESAFKGSSLLMRMYSFNDAVNLAKQEGINVDDVTELKEIGDIINTAVGRGKIDAKNPFDAVAKSILWSARLLKAKINIFTNYFTAKTPFAKKMALKSLVKFGFFIAVISALSKIFNKDETKINPLDSRFGKIPLGDKRYLSVDGGRLAIITLFAKLLPEVLGGGGKISAKTDKFVPFSTDPNGSNRLKEILYFLRNRLNPGLGAAIEIAVGQDRNFEKVTPENILMNNFVPISGQTASEIITEGPTPERFIDTALNFLGFPVSNYQDKKTSKKKKN